MKSNNKKKTERKFMENISGKRIVKKFLLIEFMNKERKKENWLTYH